MAMTILITGFGPFPGAPTNPTGPLAQKLARRRRPAFADTQRFSHVFRTSYSAIERELPALVARQRPDAILMFGLASRTRHLRVETLARNSVSSLFPDADRRKIPARRLTNDGPATAPVRAPAINLLAAARGARARARLSRDAGRYLCNALFWRALELSSKAKGPRTVAFVHVPRLRAKFRADDLARAGEAILLAILAAGRRVG